MTGQSKNKEQLLSAYDKELRLTSSGPQNFTLNLPAPSWKHPTSPTSLINSYSARRRSVLATDMPSSPSKKLVPPKEECIDLAAAINRFIFMFLLFFSPSIFSISFISRPGICMTIKIFFLFFLFFHNYELISSGNDLKLLFCKFISFSISINSIQKSSSLSSPSAIMDSNHDRQELLEETRRIVNAVKDFAAYDRSLVDFLSFSSLSHLRFQRLLPEYRNIFSYTKKSSGK
ncbi:unnamed protein product [Angiostrongylus costaricensis]|uniref:NR LBD domain-containing protein n=1 Tax=Angiostrongylus costaricensis TaxID=334426 RepID=A0A158PEP7_ANGCS|nr:unnamed protein product [Angiostrongylus costaricensis]